MGKQRAITRQEVAGIVARRKRGMTFREIEDEMKFGGDVVVIVCTAEGLTKTTAASRRKYRERLDQWLDNAKATKATGSASKAKPRRKATRRKAKAAS